ncbi:hypothetical protein XELAEV_18003914mg [Xenopus laevis]|uniref:Uncharacterized protein n=1 Tax=Xenopus laevis TaxID=8355 RepID=A0A974H015_XENLA|nr:hypothetical protein XELAEV_18003914mg [Xenopus laevis]
MDLLEVEEKENDDKPDPASVRSSGSLTDLIAEKEQKVETVLQNTTRLWKPKLRRPTFVFVNQNITPRLKEGELERPTADTTKADEGPVNVTPRMKKYVLHRPTANTTKADEGPVNVTPRMKKYVLHRPTANTTKADEGPVNRKRNMDNINIEERSSLPKKRKTGHINMDERGGMPKTKDKRGAMPKNMDERGDVPKRRKITFEDFPQKWKRENQHCWNHAPRNHTGRWKKDKQCVKNGFFTWNEPTIQVRIEMRPESSYQRKWSQPKGRTRFRPY